MLSLQFILLPIICICPTPLVCNFPSLLPNVYFNLSLSISFHQYLSLCIYTLIYSAFLSICFISFCLSASYTTFFPLHFLSVNKTALLFIFLHSICNWKTLLESTQLFSYVFLITQSQIQFEIFIMHKFYPSCHQWLSHYYFSIVEVISIQMYSYHQLLCFDSYIFCQYKLIPES